MTPRHRSPVSWLLAALLAAHGPGCAASRAPIRLDPAEARAAIDEDMLLRLSENMGNVELMDPDRLMNSLQRLQLSWQSEQRKGRARHLEVVLTQKVLPHFDIIEEAFLTGPHDRRLVAAWALGFSRVPDNELGVVSRHADAVAVLSPPLVTLPDDIMSNALLALWKIGDTSTPVRPVLEIAANHHDPEVRSNAMLTLSAILSDETADEAVDTVLQALEDDEDKVRLHASLVARRHPERVYVERLESLLPHEQTPLVRAGMAAALGAGGQPSSANVLVPMLKSPRAIESANAHQALVTIFGRDLGRNADAWIEYIGPS